MQEASPDESADKRVWRRWFRQLPTRVTADSDSAAIRRHLAGFLDGRPPLEIAAFAALPGEPDLLDALVPPHRWHLPRVDGPEVRFHAIANRETLAPGAFGIFEPTADSPLTEPGRIDLFLCPGLGFDRSGARLGRGKGYYDRLLARARPDALLIGVAFDDHVVDRLPIEPHDRHMNHLLTPGGVLEIGC